MSKKKAYIYIIKFQDDHLYCYAKNKNAVKKWIKNNRPEMIYTIIAIGEYDKLIEENFILFTKEEQSKMDRYILSKMLYMESIKNK